MKPLTLDQLSALRVSKIEQLKRLREEANRVSKEIRTIQKQIADNLAAVLSNPSITIDPNSFGYDSISETK